MPSIADIGGFIAANPHLAYGAVFLLALSEAVSVVGVLVPGSARILPTGSPTQSRSFPKHSPSSGTSVSRSRQQPA